MLWKFMTVLLAATLAAVVLMAPARTDQSVVEAERLVLRDPVKGQIVAEFGFFPKGSEKLFGESEENTPEALVGLFLYGPGGKQAGAEVGMLVTYDGRSWSDPSEDGRWPEPLIFIKHRKKGGFGDEGEYKALKPVD